MSYHFNQLHISPSSSLIDSPAEDANINIDEKNRELTLTVNAKRGKLSLTLPIVRKNTSSRGTVIYVAEEGLYRIELSDRGPGWSLGKRSVDLLLTEQRPNRMVISTMSVCP